MKFAFGALTAFIITAGSCTTSAFTTKVTTPSSVTGGTNQCHFKNKLPPSSSSFMMALREEDIIVDDFGRITVAPRLSGLRRKNAGEVEEYNFVDNNEIEGQEEDDETEMNSSNFNIQGEEEKTMKDELESNDDDDDNQQEEAVVPNVGLLAKIKAELKFKTEELESSQKLLENERKLRFEIESNMTKEYEYTVSVLNETKIRLKNEIETNREEKATALEETRNELLRQRNEVQLTLEEKYEDEKRELAETIAKLKSTQGRLQNEIKRSSDNEIELKATIESLTRTHNELIDEIQQKHNDEQERIMQEYEDGQRELDETIRSLNHRPQSESENEIQFSELIF